MNGEHSKSEVVTSNPVSFCSAHQTPDPHCALCNLLSRCPCCGHLEAVEYDMEEWDPMFVFAICNAGKGGCGTQSGRWESKAEVAVAWNKRTPVETTDLNSCRARLHDISNGPLYDLQMSATREVGLAIDEARAAIARACHDLRRAMTVAESPVEPAEKPYCRKCGGPHWIGQCALTKVGSPEKSAGCTLEGCAMKEPHGHTHLLSCQIWDLTKQPKCTCGTER